MIWMINATIRDLSHYTPEYAFLATAAPEIVEKFVADECNIITPYDSYLREGTFLNLISTTKYIAHPKNHKQYIDGLLVNCTYLFENHLCTSGIYQNSLSVVECDLFRV